VADGVGSRNLYSPVAPVSPVRVEQPMSTVETTPPAASSSERRVN
jgi:hypothetical protein